MLSGTRKKPAALLKRLGPQLGDLQQLAAAGEGAVFLPVFHNILGSGGIEAGHPAQQAGGGGVHVHAHGVDAVLHHAGQGLVQPLLGHIVLVLAHADGLGVDLHQLRQGVLQPPGDGHGAAEVHVILRKLLRRQLAGGVYGGPGLVDHHIADAAAQLPDQLHRHLLRLPAGGAVADGNMRDAMAAYQLGQAGDGLLSLAADRRWDTPRRCPAPGRCRR